MFTKIALLLAGASQASAVSLQVRPAPGAEANWTTKHEANWTRAGKGGRGPLFFNLTTKHQANWTLAAGLAGQLEYELNMQASDHPAKNKLVLVLLELFWLPGLLGVDRCYMGQTCLGVVKGLTLGGLSVWFLLDYFAVIITCLSFSPYINAVGMRANFTPHGCTVAAFWVTLVVLILKCCCTTAAGGKWAFLRGRSPGELLLIFKSLDKNDDGKLTKEELVQGLSLHGFSEADIDAMLLNADADKDGRINYLEFVQFAAKQ